MNINPNRFGGKINQSECDAEFKRNIEERNRQA